MELSDILDLIQGSEPSAQQKAQALATALRGQPAAAQGQSAGPAQMPSAQGGPNDFAQLLQMTGKPSLAGMGNSMIEDSQNQRQNLTHMVGQGLQRAMEARRIAQGEEKIGLARDRFDANGKIISTDQGFGKVDKDNNFVPITDASGAAIKAPPRRGAGAGVAAPTPGAPGIPGMKPAAYEALWKNLADKLNPSGGRAGELGKNQARINAATRLKSLIQNPDGTIRNLDSREMPELAMGLQNLLSPGGHSAEEVKNLIPSTIMGDGAKILEWFTNEPHGKNQQAFAEKMAHTVDREEQTARKSLQGAQYGLLPNLGAPLAKADRKRFDAAIKGLGLDPAALDESLLYKEPAQATATPTAQAVQTHWAISPDKTMRRAIDANGKVIPGSKSEPNPDANKPVPNG